MQIDNTEVIKIEDEFDESTPKRGRVPVMKDFRFHKIVPDNIEELVNDYINNGNFTSYENGILPFFQKIYDFYNDRKEANKRRKFYRRFVNSFTLNKDEFINILKNFLDQYIAYKEVSFYHYLKQEIDELFECLDPKRYFYNREEDAMSLFLALKKTNTRRSDLIYKKFLDYPFKKLVENLINTYQLTSNRISFEDLQLETIAFLHEKMDKFDPKKGRAYSYFGTIAKHKLQAVRIEEHKDKLRNYSYENAYNDLGDDERYSYTEKFYETNPMVNLFKELPQIILDYIVEDSNDKNILTDNEKKIGNSLVEIFKHWDKISDGSKKINKNTLFECLRSMTGLETKDIRISLNIYKSIYFQSKMEKVNIDYNPFDSE
jgi:hypothetical protein